MLLENITLNTQEFRTQVINPTATLRSVAGLPFGSTKTLRVSHDTSKDGVVSSACIIDTSSIDVDPLSDTNGSTLTDRVMVKFSYDKTANHDYATALKSALADMIVLLDATNVDLILNQEH